MAKKIVIVGIVFLTLILVLNIFVGLQVASFLAPFNLPFIGKSFNDVRDGKSSTVEIVGIGMDPNYKKGQYYLIENKPYVNSVPLRSDVVVFPYVDDQGETQFIKRVIGLPGETIRISNGIVYVNGEILPEPYISTNVYTQGNEFIPEDTSVVIPDGTLVVLGDNRSYSSDSRFWGFLPIENITGKVTECYKNCE